MSFRINTNVTASNAYRNLSMTGSELAKATTRLSTGLRINNGSDDPSGLIASESYRAQIGGIDAALRNNQDALNYAKTAEGGLDEVSRLLRDARALAVANGNSTLDSAQKQANQTQLNNILSSIDRISQNTQFGTQKLLDGSAGTSATIVKTNNASSANFSGTFGGSSVTVAGQVDVNVTTAAEQATLSGTVTFSAGTVLTGAGSFTVNGKTFTTNSATTRDQLLQQINEASAETGVTASITAGNAFKFDSVAYGTEASVSFVDHTGLLKAQGGATDAGANAVATVTYTPDGGSAVTAAFDKGKGLELRDVDGNSITLTKTGNATGSVTSVARLSADASKFQIGGNSGQTASLSIGNYSASSLSISGLDITGSSVDSALTSLDAAISRVAEDRGRIGSFMKNTLESNVRSLGVARENLSATESSLREIDVAQEMTNFTKLQILQQSGLSVLSQANSAPQSVLSLLR